MKRVGVIGGGSWGTSIANILGLNGFEALLYVRNPEQRQEINEEHQNSRYLRGFDLSPKVRAVETVEEAARNSKLIIMVVPTKVFRPVARELGEYVQGDQMILSASKGFELSTFKRMTQILREETCCRKIGALSGPNLAKEIMQGQPCATVVASRYEEVAQAGARVLHSSRCRVYLNDDLVGVEVGGAMKNIYAIAAGILSGLGLGANTQAMMVTRGLAEMRRVGQRLGAVKETFMGLAGIGDLMVTCGSALSRNFRVGLGLGKGQTLEEVLDSLGMVAEGVRTTKAVHLYAKQEKIYVPIAEAMHRVLHEGMAISEVVGDLMKRRARYEVDDIA